MEESYRSRDHAPSITAVTSGQTPAPRFGDIIENGWASERNPTRVGFFVREGRRTGRMNPGRYFEVTDGAGKFWELPVTSDHKITVRPAQLDQAWAAVNVLGAPDTACRTVEYLAYCRGIGDALAEIEKLGGRSV